MRFWKWVLSALLILALLLFPVSGEEHKEESGDILPNGSEGIAADCRSAVLMEAKTGKILYSVNGEEAMPPASVTKIMSLILVMEAIEEGKLALDDKITASANAASMGGSQIFLEEGEEMTVDDLLKSVVIASANDATVALAEAVAGSEEAFVARMNARAGELGARTAHFENTNGLDDTTENHVLSARDIAILSRALIRHERILTYSSTWMDTVRDGAFGLSNTNRLVRYYRGCTGLKTGSTEKAGFCVSVTAERDGLSLIAVIMGAPSRDARNAAAAKLLDFGFANYAFCTIEGGEITGVPVVGGVARTATLVYPAFSSVVKKGEEKKIEKSLSSSAVLTAPVHIGDRCGEVIYSLSGKELGRVPMTSSAEIPKMTYQEIFFSLLRAFLLRENDGSGDFSE